MENENLKRERLSAKEEVKFLSIGMVGALILSLGVLGLVKVSTYWLPKNDYACT